MCGHKSGDDLPKHSRTRARAHTHTHTHARTHTHTHVLTHTFKTWEESAMNESLTMTCPNSFRIKSIHTCGGEIK